MKPKPLESLVKNINFLFVRHIQRFLFFWVSHLSAVDTPEVSLSRFQRLKAKFSLSKGWNMSEFDPNLRTFFSKWHLQQHMKYSILIISPSITHFYAECCGEGVKRKANEAARRFGRLSSSLRHRGGGNLCITYATVII